LGKKLRGLGEGFWNGFGGKVEEDDQSIEDSVIRELEEESCITISSLDREKLKQIGINFFGFEGSETLFEVHVFTIELDDKHFDQVRETDEMRPEWWELKIEEMPFDEMWEDDRFWFEMLIENVEGRKVDWVGRFDFEKADEGRRVESGKMVQWRILKS